MKKISIIIGLLFFATVFNVKAQTNNIGCVRLAWVDNNPVGQVTEYHLYHSTNLAIPLTNWTLIATVPYGQTNAPINIPVGAHFFFMAAFNVTWGLESLPSNVASTNTVGPLSALILTITGMTPTNGP